MVDVCERCNKEAKLETVSYRVVCLDGSFNIDAKYCTECCDEIEQQDKERMEKNE